MARIDDFIKEIGKKEKRLKKFREEQRLDRDHNKDKRVARANAALNTKHHERAEHHRDSMAGYNE
jgi:hypothetical protein